jgi:hypothetical protein
MRLFSLAGAAAVDDPEFGHFEPVDDGGFDFPGPLSERMHATAVRGQKQWENAIERQRRLITEEAARRADPATLLEAVEKLVQAAKATPPAEPEAPKGRGKTAASKS